MMMMRQVLSRSVTRSSSRCSSSWTSYPMAPPDPIIGLGDAFRADLSSEKVIVGVGAYRDDGGLPYVLPCVRAAEKLLQEKGVDHEYSGIAGDPAFVDLALKFAYGEDSQLFKDKRVGGVQALSGTGGLRVFGEMIHKFGHSHIYIPNPSWGNHKAIFTNSGLEVRQYAYYNSEASDLDFEKMMDDIAKMPEQSCILLHACAHNPTGMDPTLAQWKEISDAIKSRNLLPFFDCAYQGFASGDAVKDAAALRLFVEEGHENLALVQSFSKNFGLYGQRVGALSVVGETAEQVSKVVSQMKMVIRPMYSNPPRHGARIVSTILEDEILSKDFYAECKGMADRIQDMRTALETKLADSGSIRNWGHITKQIGMFAYSGLSKEQVMELKEKHHIYCTADGRISMAGVTSHNVEYIANAIHDVSK